MLLENHLDKSSEPALGSHGGRRAQFGVDSRKILKKWGLSFPAYFVLFVVAGSSNKLGVRWLCVAKQEEGALVRGPTGMVPQRGRDRASAGDCPKAGSWGDRVEISMKQLVTVAPALRL